MSSVDKRIVEMEFRNNNFEQGANKSISTIDRLTEKLKFKNADKGISDIVTSSNKLNFNAATEGVNAFQVKLSALSVAGIAALTNITNSAVNAGKRIASALTIDPVKMGFSEYETKIGAIQTILTNTASKGTTLDDVTKALGELNTYADKTIYNFSEMTKNIGTFTAAGVDLETAVSAIKGIANLAAGSGSTPQQAATAMYQLSQALAAGRVSLQDWNSVVNAGMGGELLQKELIATAKGMGIVVDEGAPFRETLKDGWLTADVLTKTLNKFAEDEALVKAATQVKTFTGLWDTMKESVQSGWALSWEYIIGDFDQAPELLTNISEAFNDMIQPSADARNEMLKFWNEAGGREDVIAGVTNIVKNIGSVLKAASDGFREVIPPMTGEKLVEFSSKFREITEQFKMNDTVLKNVKSVFRALGSVIELVCKSFTLLGTVMKPITNIIDDIFLSISRVIGGFSELISKTVDYINDVKLFEGISEFINTLYSNIQKIGGFIGNIFKTIVSGARDIQFGDIFKPVLDSLGKVGDGFTSILSGIGALIGTLDVNSLLKVINTLLIGKGMNNLKTLIKEIGETTDSVSSFGDNVSSIIGSITDTFEAMQTRLKADALMKIAGAIGVLSLSLVVLSSIDEKGMDNALVGMVTLATTLTLSLMSLLKVINGGNIGSLFFLGGAIKSIATAMLLLSGAMKVMSTISWEGISKGLIGVVTLTATLTASMKLLSGNKTSFGLPMALLATASSILILAQVVKQISGINASDMTVALVSIGALMTELGVFMKVMQSTSMKPSSILGVLTVAGALSIMSLAVTQLSKIDVNSMIVGLSGLGVMLAELSLFVKMIGSGNSMISTSVGITILSGAMLLLMESVKRLGSMNPENLTKGLIGLAGALTAIGVGAMVIPKDLIGKSVGLTILSVALMNISNVISAMGSNSWEEIAKGLVGIGGSLVVLAGGLRLMGGTLLGSAALTVAAAGLSLLTIQFKTLASLNLTQICLGLLAMAGVLGVLGGAGLLLAPLTPAILGLSGSMVALSASAAIMAGSLTLTGAGLALISASALMIVEALRQFTGVFPKFVDSIFTSFDNFGNGFSNSLSTLSSNIGQIVMMILQIFKDLVLHIPEVVKIGVDMVIGFVDGILSQTDRIITAGVTMIVKVCEGLLLHMSSIAQAALDIIIAFVGYIASNLGMVIQAGVDLALAFIDGVADAIDNNHERVKSSITHLITAFCNAGLSLLSDSVGAFLNGGSDIIGGLIDGIKAKASAAKQSVDDTIDKAVSGAKDLGGKLKSAGEDLINGFKNGIKAKAQSVIDSVTSVVNGAVNKAKALLGIHSPSRVFAEIGDFTVQGFSKGIDDNKTRAIKSIGTLTTKVVSSFKDMMDGIDTDINPDINPVIRPVLDLGAINSGRRTINDITSGLSSIGGVSASLSSSIKMDRDSSNLELLSEIKSLNKTLSRPNNINHYNIDGITYDDGSAISNTIGDLVRIARIERRK